MHGPVLERGMGTRHGTEGRSAQPHGKLIARDRGTGVKSPRQKGVPMVGIAT